MLSVLESGNLPEFAHGHALAFWIAADNHERVNGRVYTELQVALPHELNQNQRDILARGFTRELLGTRFAYTLAVHTSAGKACSEQSDMHLMFSERAITEQTRQIDSEHFFKRNGARKDHGWNKRSRPQEVRVMWVNNLNRALEQAGLRTRVDARSWAEQGRQDLSSLREPKLFTGKGPPTPEARAEVNELRRQREKLPAMHLNYAAGSTGDLERGGARYRGSRATA